MLKSQYVLENNIFHCVLKSLHCLIVIEMSGATGLIMC